MLFLLTVYFNHQRQKLHLNVYLCYVMFAYLLCLCFKIALLLSINFECLCKLCLFGKFFSRSRCNNKVELQTWGICVICESLMLRIMLTSWSLKLVNSYTLTSVTFLESNCS